MKTMRWATLSALGTLMLMSGCKSKAKTEEASPSVALDSAAPANPSSAATEHFNDTPIALPSVLSGPGTDRAMAAPAPASPAATRRGQSALPPPVQAPTAPPPPPPGANPDNR